VSSPNTETGVLERYSLTLEDASLAALAWHTAASRVNLPYFLVGKFPCNLRNPNDRRKLQNLVVAVEATAVENRCQMLRETFQDRRDFVIADGDGDDHYIILPTSAKVKVAFVAAGSGDVPPFVSEQSLLNGSDKQPLPCFEEVPLLLECVTIMVPAIRPSVSLQWVLKGYEWWNHYTREQTEELIWYLLPLAAQDGSEIHGDVMEKARDWQGRSLFSKTAEGMLWQEVGVQKADLYPKFREVTRSIRNKEIGLNIFPPSPIWHVQEHLQAIYRRLYCELDPLSFDQYKRDLSGIIAFLNEKNLEVEDELLYLIAYSFRVHGGRDCPVRDGTRDCFSASWYSLYLQEMVSPRHANSAYYEQLAREVKDSLREVIKIEATEGGYKISLKRSRKYFKVVRFAEPTAQGWSGCGGEALRPIQLEAPKWSGQHGESLATPTSCPCDCPELKFDIRFIDDEEFLFPGIAHFTAEWALCKAPDALSGKIPFALSVTTSSQYWRVITALRLWDPDAVYWAVAISLANPDPTKSLKGPFSPLFWSQHMGAKILQLPKLENPIAQQYIQKFREAITIETDLGTTRVTVDVESLDLPDFDSQLELWHRCSDKCTDHFSPGDEWRAILNRLPMCGGRFLLELRYNGMTFHPSTLGTFSATFPGEGKSFVETESLIIPQSLVFSGDSLGTRLNETEKAKMSDANELIIRLDKPPPLDPVVFSEIFSCMENLKRLRIETRVLDDVVGLMGYLDQGQFEHLDVELFLAGFGDRIFGPPRLSFKYRLCQPPFDRLDGFETGFESYESRPTFAIGNRTRRVRLKRGKLDIDPSYDIQCLYLGVKGWPYPLKDADLTSIFGLKSLERLSLTNPELERPASTAIISGSLEYGQTIGESMELKYCLPHPRQVERDPLSAPVECDRTTHTAECDPESVSTAPTAECDPVYPSVECNPEPVSTTPTTECDPAYPSVERNPESVSTAPTAQSDPVSASVACDSEPALAALADEPPLLRHLKLVSDRATSDVVSLGHRIIKICSRLETVFIECPTTVLLPKGDSILASLFRQESLIEFELRVLSGDYTWDQLVECIEASGSPGGQALKRVHIPFPMVDRRPEELDFERVKRLRELLPGVEDLILSVPRIASEAIKFSPDYTRTIFADPKVRGLVTENLSRSVNRDDRGVVVAQFRIKLSCT